ncbi:MAG: DUF169 domain-containing protein [Candidatus Fermentibacteraceae bacterium]
MFATIWDDHSIDGSRIMTVREAEDLFFSQLKFETRPVAVRLLADRTELGKKPFPMKLNICQLISMARHGGRATAAVPDRMVCSIGASCAGLVKTTPALVSGEAAVGKYTADAEAGKVFFENTYKLGDGGKVYDAIELAPLGDAVFEPQVVLFYANPAQVMRLVHTVNRKSGEKVAADTVAEAAVCSAIGFVLGEDRPMIGFPCAGDRRFGGTQNHELVFAAPWHTVREVMAPNLVEMAKAGPLYPVPPHVLYDPVMPLAYTLEEEDL